MSRSAVEIRIGLGSCGIASGGERFKAVEQEARQAGASGVVKAVGCNGMCHREPLVEVVEPGRTHTLYGNVHRESGAPDRQAAHPARVVSVPGPRWRAERSRNSSRERRTSRTRRIPVRSPHRRRGRLSRQAEANRPRELRRDRSTAHRRLPGARRIPGTGHAA